MPSNGSGRNLWLERGERQHSSRSATFRTHTRYAASTRALLTHVQSGWQRQVEIENIGLGGARVAVDDDLLSGDVVTLSFAAVAARKPFVLRGRIVWVTPPLSPATVASPPPSSRTTLRGRGSHSAAGLAFEHASASALFALYELISASQGDEI